MTYCTSSFAWLGVTALLVGLAYNTVEAQSSDGEDYPNVLEEVIVNAQKRSEDAQDVPVAVSVLTAQEIDDSGLLTLQELVESDPSVAFDTAQSFQNSSLKIRGIGTFGNGRTFEGSVGVFIDGVYRTRSGMALLDMLDIDRVEILRGPQGTLLGKNTVAGAIAQYSVRPVRGEVLGQAELRFGNYGERYASGVVNAPLGGTGAFRLAANLHERDAFVTSPDNGDPYDEIDRYALKGQALFNPSEDLELLLIADYAESDANCCWASPQVVNGPLAPVIATYSALNGLSFVPAPTAEDDRLQSLNSLPRERVKDRGVTAIVNWNLASASLKSITAMRWWDNDQIQGDADFTGADLLRLDEPTSIDTFSQEFNLNFETGRANWLLGAYYGHEEYDSTRTVYTSQDTDNYLNFLISTQYGAMGCLPPVAAFDCVFPVGIGALLDDGPLSRERYYQNGDNWALFGHVVTQLTDHSNLVLGGRYSIDEKKGGVDVQYWYDSPIIRAVLAGLGIPDDGTPRNGLDLIGTLYSPSFQDRTRDEEFTGTIAYQYLLPSGTMLYAKYDTGYKAGGVNLFREAVVTNTPTYSPETADSFELGLKTEYLDGRARSNLYLFYTSFDDLQINFFDGLNFRTENTGKATSKGAELENDFQVNEHWRLGLSVTYLNARFGNLDAPELAYLVDRDTPRAPRWAGVFSAGWDQPLSNGWGLFARGLVSYNGEYYVGADVPWEEKAPAYTLFDVSFGLRSADGHWELLAWCHNCSDESYRTILFNSTFQPGSENAFLNAPRQYGLTLRAYF